MPRDTDAKTAETPKSTAALPAERVRIHNGRKGPQDFGRIPGVLGARAVTVTEDGKKVTRVEGGEPVRLGPPRNGQALIAWQSLIAARKAQGLPHEPGQEGVPAQPLPPHVDLSTEEALEVLKDPHVQLAVRRKEIIVERYTPGLESEGLTGALARLAG